MGGNIFETKHEEILVTVTKYGGSAEVLVMGYESTWAEAQGTPPCHVIQHLVADGPGAALVLASSMD